MFADYKIKLLYYKMENLKINHTKPNYIEETNFRVSLNMTSL